MQITSAQSLPWKTKFFSSDLCFFFSFSFLLDGGKNSLHFIHHFAFYMHHGTYALYNFLFSHFSLGSIVPFISDMVAPRSFTFHVFRNLSAIAFGYVFSDFSFLAAFILTSLPFAISHFPRSNRSFAFRIVISWVILIFEHHSVILLSPVSILVQKSSLT